MKKVFANHSDVCHVWAQQNQESGRASSIFFEGRIIYSYGYHYKMACFHNDIVLINSRGYSSSTGKHTGHVRSAVSHLRAINCPLVDPHGAPDHAQNIQYFNDTIMEKRGLMIRAHKRGAYYMETAEKCARDYNVYIKMFELDEKIIDVSGLFSDSARAELVEKLKKERKREAVKKAQRLELLKPELLKWEAGGSTAFNLYDAPVKLRIKDGIIETSYGARCSIKDALPLVKMLVSSQDPAGLYFGGYTVSGWRNGFLIIGCHKIAQAEAVKICDVLGLKSLEAV